MLEERRGRRPDRLRLYWTGEPSRERALMSFDHRLDDVANAVAHTRTVCEAYDFRSYCVSQGTTDVKVIA